MTITTIDIYRTHRDNRSYWSAYRRAAQECIADPSRWDPYIHQIAIAFMKAEGKEDPWQ